MAEPFVRPNAPLSLVLLTYTAELDAVDALMAEHVAWLAKGFAEGLIVVAGRRTPRTGGVILFRGDKDAVEALAATDPFVTGGVATAEVIGFSASLAVPELETLLT